MTLGVAILFFGTTGRGGMETVIATTLRQFELDGDVPRLFLLVVVQICQDTRPSRHRAWICK